MIGFCFAIQLNAEEHLKHHDREPSTALLPKPLNDILLQEMRALSQGLSDLTPEITSGNWKNIHAIGVKMHDSYILKQSLTKEQIKHLHHTLPPHFKALDHQLHHSAKMMAHAAEKKNIELVNFYLYKMVDTCTSCHSHYAKERFPELTPRTKHH